jgi:hypothetical protein
MLGRILAALLVLLGIVGTAALGWLVVSGTQDRTSIQWPVACLLVALSYMITYGLTCTHHS